MGLGMAVVAIFRHVKFDRNTFKWIAGVLLALFSLSSFLQEGYAAGVCFAVGAAICIPPVCQLISDTIRYRFFSWQKYLILVFSVVPGFILIPKVAKDSAVKSSALPPGAEWWSDSTDASLTARLKAGIAQLEKPFSPAGFRGSEEALRAEIDLFASWARMVDQGDSSPRSEDRKLSATLREKIGQVQSKAFPALRRALVERLDQRYAKDRIRARCAGNGCSTLELVGPSFSDKRTLKNLHADLAPMLLAFRFGQLHGKTAADTDLYSGMTFDSPEDSELVKAEGE